MILKICYILLAISCAVGGVILFDIGTLMIAKSGKDKAQLIKGILIVIISLSMFTAEAMSIHCIVSK